jgi:predicted AAA+ superfamily ATPase
VDQPVRAWPELVREQIAPAEEIEPLARRGGYPAPSYELGTDEQRAQWFDGYAATYLERDVRQLSQIESLADLRRLITALCLRLGGLLNQAELSRDISLPSSTVQRYVNLLEVSYQLVRVPGYAVNRTRRLIKAPRIYWSDTGLAMHLAGETAMRGAHLENLVLTDLLAWSSAEIGRPEILHWRTNTGAEVDFVIELPERLLPVEVKSSRRVSFADARHLRTFLDDYAGQANCALLLYGGEDTFWVDRGILAVPWHRVI